MNWDQQRTRQTEFANLLNSLKITVPANAPLAAQIQIVDQFLKERAGLSSDELFAKQDPKDFKDFNDAVSAVNRLSIPALNLASQPGLKSRLNRILSGSLTQDFQISEAKDIAFELEVASTLKDAGFTIELAEPDVVVRDNGLSQPLGLACKYLTGTGSLQEHITKGYKQIKKQGIQGCVVLGVDNLVANEAFNSPPKFIYFDGGDKHPGDVLDRVIGNVMKKLVEKRSLYPSEPPLDGAIATIRFDGIWRKSFATVESWVVQVSPEHPAKTDIELLAREAAKLISR